MDDAEYRRLCAAPDVLRRTDLRATFVRLGDREPLLAGLIERILRSSPVPKPIEHSGGVDSDYLWLDLSSESIAEIHEALREQESELAQDPSAETAVLSWVAQLADLWNDAESSRPDAV